MIRPTLVLTASLFIYACGGGGSGDSADETVAENNPEIGNTDDSTGGTDNPEDSANLPDETDTCLLYTSPSPRDQRGSRMPSSA